MTKTEELVYTSRTTGWRGTPRKQGPPRRRCSAASLLQRFAGPSGLSLERRKMERED